MLQSILAAMVLAAPPPIPPGSGDSPDPVPKPGDSVYGAAYSRYGNVLALAQPKTRFSDGDDRVTLYDTTNWSVLWTLTGPTKACYSLAFSPDQAILYAASIDGRVYSWNVESGSKGPVVEADAGECDIVIPSPDGKRLIASYLDNRKLPGKATIRCTNLDGTRTYWTLGPAEDLAPHALAATPDGNVVGTLRQGGGENGVKEYREVVEWDAETGKEYARYPIEPSGLGHRIAYSGDGKRIAVGGLESTINAGNRVNCGRIWVFDRSQRKLISSIKFDGTDDVWRIQFGHDTDTLFLDVTISAHWMVYDGRRAFGLSSEIRRLNLADGRTCWTHATPNTHGWVLLPSPEGRRLLVTRDRGTYFLDPNTGDAKGGLFIWNGRR